jgi:hypothetical protein
MAGVLKLVLMAVVFLVPGGSLLLAGYAAHLALRQRALAPIRRDNRPTRRPR